LGLLDRALGAFGLKRATPAPRRRSSFDGAAVNRLTFDWATTILSADQELRGDLRKLRARSRELFRNNDYARRFGSLMAANVVGPAGIQMDANILTPRGKEDEAACEKVETAWLKWNKLGNCEVTGQLSGLDLQRLLVTTLAQDGEVLIRLVNGKGPHGFQVQVLDVDQLGGVNDSSVVYHGKNIVQMGVEKDAWGKPIAYHISETHPSDAAGTKKTIRVPAEEIIHAFIPGRPGQSRGIPFLVTAMKSMSMLDGYMEAELVAARMAAAKMGFFTSDLGDAYTGDGSTDAPNIDAEPGLMTGLPPGYKFQAWDPQHPTAAFPAFQKAILRSIASGCGVAYNGLANDLEGVNFSSIRSGVLEEREQWRMLQTWMIEHICQPIFEAWLEMAVLSGALSLPTIGGNLDKYKAPKWVPRGWAWVDPKKDVEASVLAIEKGLKTRTQVLAEQGQDFDEVLEQLAAEKVMAEDLGLDFTTAPPAGSTTTKKPEPEPVDGEEVDDAA